jgi:hypothetical protein
MKADPAILDDARSVPGSAIAAKNRRVIHVILCLAIAYGVGSAYYRRWVCDDAFISYRYALNLVEGHGLVFNSGERVEGYTNFLWTLWCAVALLLKLPCEQWTMAWGIVFYGLSLGLLGYHFLLVRRATGLTGFALPVAAMLGALHSDWAIYATSGLETSLFTFLALLGYVLLARGIVDGHHRPVAVGLVMTLCALTRPDGVIFALIIGAVLFWLTWPRARPVLWYALVFGVPQAAFLAWRIGYYGDIFPNTYYAKSGDQAWWTQGWHYLSLYLQRYAALALAIPAMCVCVARRANASDAGSRLFSRLAFACAAMGGAYTLFIVRVGGDFMFARMLIPATPFFLMLIEMGLTALPKGGAALRAGIAVGIALALALPSAPMKDRELAHGVANEWTYYGDYMLRETKSGTLRKYLSDLPVCIAFMGAEAHLMYKGRIPTAIESEAGLTDRFVAHQEIRERGRVGHEKNAPVDYLIRRRKAHFTFHPVAVGILRLDKHLINCQINLDGVPGYVLHWDPAIIDTLRRRGAQVEDLPARINQLIAHLSEGSDDVVADLYARLRLMYFDHVHDPQREAPFRKRLGLSGTTDSGNQGA